MKRQLSRFLSVLLAFVMFFGLFPKSAHAEEPAEDYKFKAEVSSVDSTGKKNAVTATVYADYKAEIVIDEGNVNTGNVTVGLWMKNVASLGVTGERHYERTIQTGMTPRDASLDTVVGLFGNLKNATVIGRTGGKSVTYTVTNEGRVITGTPDSYANASAVWHAMVNSENITAGTHAEDSYIIVPKGSYLQVAGQILTVDKDLKVDNLSDIPGAIQNIRDAVTMQAAEKAIENAVIYLEPGTELAIGSSTAKLNEGREAKITIDIAGFDESAFIENLNQLKNAGGVEEMIKAAFGGISALTTAMDSKTTTVDFTFGHVYGEPTYEWAEDYSKVTATAVCENDPDHVLTETVETVKTEADGKIIYTATFENEIFEEQTREVEGEKDYKFIVEVSSEDSTGKKNAVTGTVYPDYKAVLVIDEGNVNTGNVTFAFWMKNVASLGVDGVRHYERAIKTGIEGRDVSLDTVVGLFSNLKKATLIGKAEDKSVTYTLTNEGRVITGTPDSFESASGVWHAIVNDDNIAYGTGADDSYLFIPKGSYVQVGSSVLSIDKDLNVDDLSDLKAVEAAIRDAATLKTAEEAIENVVIYLEPKTKLAMGTSFAELKRDAKITADIDGYEEKELEPILSELRDAGTIEDMIKTVFKGISAVTTAMDGKTTTVEFEFDHKFGEPEYVWAEDNSTVTAKAVCENNPEHVIEETAEVTETVTTEPGCETEGVKTLTAEFENEVFETQTKTESIEALGHDWGEWEVVKEPTKTETGLKRRTCKRCGEVEEEEIPMLEPVNVTSVELNKDELTLRVGKEETLVATVLPEDADDKSVTWSSSDTSIATVDANGKVTAVADLGIAEPSTAVITVTTNDGSYTATCTVTVEDPINAFVRRLYKLCLNRLADPSGFKNWTNALRTKQKTAAQVVQGFFNSKEMKNMELSDDEWVERCYLVIMDRSSDVTGKANWVDKRGSGVSNNYILKGFVESREFAKICSDFGIDAGTITLTEWRDQNIGVTKFVSRCYQEVLGRKADVGGLNNWCKKILTASNKKKVAIETASTGFFHSTEYQNKKTTNEQYVTTLYHTFLGREPDTKGYNNWVNKLKSGTSRDTVMMGFANSTEFAKIMKEYGIE